MLVRRNTCCKQQEALTLYIYRDFALRFVAFRPGSVCHHSWKVGAELLSRNGVSAVDSIESHA